jgi:hypothetical protein
MLTEAEIWEKVRAAQARGKQDHLIEPWAVKAWYDDAANLVMVQIRNGCVFGFPPREGQGIENATPEQLARVSIEPSGGEAVHWEELDADISVPGIMFDLLNVRGWYAKWMGSATSEAKAAAARENGKKGGRPRTRPAPGREKKDAAHPRTKAPAARRARSRNRVTGGD